LQGAHDPEAGAADLQGKPPRRNRETTRSQMMRTDGRRLRLCPTPREILLPATFGVLIGREEGLDPQFLQGDVLRRAQSHNSAEQSEIEIMADVGTFERSEVSTM
jgi:hypothetical protein